MKNGIITGEIIEPICFGHGKLIVAEKFLLSLGKNIGETFFYTDSISDVPMLERVNHPIVVNPDPKLRRLAKERGWEIHIFKKTMREGNT